MIRWPILRALLVKDFRVTTRDSQQRFGFAAMVLSIAFLAFTMSMEERIERQQAEARPSAAARGEPAPSLPPSPRPAPPAVDRQRTESTAAPPAEPAAAESAAADGPAELAGFRAVPQGVLVRWGVIGIALGLSFYGAIFAVPLALANFVGEKEEGTIEVLLSAPLSDLELFGHKVISVTLLGSLMGYLLLVVGLCFGLVKGQELFEEVGHGVLVVPLLLALPLPVCFSALFCAVGAVISVRAETVKGAGQLFGAFFLVVFLVLPGLLALAAGLGLEKLMLGTLLAFLLAPFLLQVGLLYLAVLGVTGGAVVLGWGLVKRERLLS